MSLRRFFMGELGIYECMPYKLESCSHQKYVKLRFVF